MTYVSAREGAQPRSEAMNYEWHGNEDAGDLALSHAAGASEAHNEAICDEAAHELGRALTVSEEAELLEHCDSWRDVDRFLDDEGWE